MYRQGTRKQNNGTGRADDPVTFVSCVVFLHILCRPTPTQRGPATLIKKIKKKWKILNVIPETPI